MSMIIDGTNGLTFNNATTQASAGNVLQVVNATYSTAVSTSTPGSFVATGLTATITPKFSTSKILVLVNQNGGYDGSSIYSGLCLNLYRGSTFLVGTNSIGNTGNQTSAHYLPPIVYSYLDSPATTSATTYSTKFANQEFGGGTVTLQLSSQISTITLMEIAS